MAAKKSTPATKDVVPVDAVEADVYDMSVFEALENGTAIEDIFAGANDGRGIVESYQFIDDGCRFVKKDELENEAFVIIDWRFKNVTQTNSAGEEEEREMAFVRAWSPTIGRVSFSDSSQIGVRAQLRQLEANNINGGVVCKNGLESRHFTSKDGKNAVSFRIK